MLCLLNRWLLTCDHTQLQEFLRINQSNRNYTRDLTLERITSGKVHLGGLAPGQNELNYLKF